MNTADLIITAYPFAASEEGLYLLHDPIDSPPLMKGFKAAHECELLEYILGITEEELVDRHQTSSREDEYDGYWNYAIAAVAPKGVPVKVKWPEARGIPTWWLQDDLPIPHDPAEPPEPRFKDIMRHALRHLAFLVLFDDPAWRGYPPVWREQLNKVRPAFYTTFGRDGRYPIAA